VMVGAVAWDQAVPFQWSMSAREPRPVYLAPFELPTAQALVSEVALTPCRLAFCPVGGIDAMVQPFDASAEPAPRTRAVPIASGPSEVRVVHSRGTMVVAAKNATSLKAGGGASGGGPLHKSLLRPYPGRWAKSVHV
jgi:hypothetical protein